MSRTFSDNGFLLFSYPQAKGSVVTFLTEEHGKISGFTRSVSREKNAIQAGNFFTLSYYARLEEHLGKIQLSLDHSFQSTLLFNPVVLKLFTLIQNLLDLGLRENEKHTAVFKTLKEMLEKWEKGKVEEVIKDYFLFEILFLAESGYGLNLKQCALTGKTENLIYLSPRTGCVASREAGEKYKDKLFSLPPFFLDLQKKANTQDLINSQKALHHFFNQSFGENLSPFLTNRQTVLDRLILSN
ncbi:MAG: DNA repair protein RecO [Alphaproteobacteria bacterium]